MDAQRWAAAWPSDTAVVAAGATAVGVIVPVRDGTSTLGAMLANLLAQAAAVRAGGRRDVAVVVAVNGTRDDSAAIARRQAPAFRAAGVTYRVIETPPGRASALNHGERELPAGHRVYADQDALLGRGSLAAIAAVLDSGVVHFAVPRLLVPPMRSPIAGAYYRTLLRMPYVLEAPVSMGVYAVSAAGRARWTEFPAVHSDDKFARLHFRPHERRLVGGATYGVTLPDGAGPIVSARRRYVRGNRELARMYPELAAGDGERRRAGVWSAVLARPSRWLDAALFGGLYAAAWAGAARG